MPSNDADPSPRSAPVRLLIVDGDPIDAASTRRRALRAFPGGEATITATVAGAAALIDAAHVPFDALVVELEFPRLRRAEAIRKLRRRLPNAAVIAMGDGEADRDAADALDAGAHEYLAKDDLCVERLRRSVRRAQARLSHELYDRKKARTDAMTGLPNALGAMDFLERAVHRAARDHTATPALICVSVDGLPRINALGGRALGDGVLRRVAQRLSNHLRKSERIARLEGGIFAIMRRSEGPDDDEAFAALLASSLSEPFDLEDERLHLLPRVGLAHWRPGMSAVALLQCADTALRTAKAPVDGVVEASGLHRGLVDGSLRRRLAHAPLEEFNVVYQPIVDALRGQPIHMEALLRWCPADGSPVPAANFLEALEATGAILRVGAWVLDQACSACGAWRERGLSAGVSVNLSPLQIADPTLVDKVAAALDRAALPADALTLEISEHASLHQLELAEGQLGRLRTLGVQTALDDFGANTASLRHLRRLPFDVLKIDRRFVGFALAQNHETHGSLQDREIVAGVTGLAHALGMRVIAEGVETATQRDALTACGCDWLQGYLLGRPTSDWRALLPATVAA